MLQAARFVNGLHSRRDTIFPIRRQDIGKGRSHATKKVELLPRRSNIRSHAAGTSGLSVRILINRRGPLLAIEASGGAGADSLTVRPRNSPGLAD